MRGSPRIRLGEHGGTLMAGSMLRGFVALCVLVAAAPCAMGAAASEHVRYRGTIVVSILGDPTRTGGFDRLVEAYNRFQPDVTVKIEVKGGGLGAGYPTWLNTQLASGDPRPDLVSGNYSPTYARYVNFDYYRYCTNPYTGNRWDQDLNFDFSPSRNNLGVRMMLPTQAVHIQWFYNVDVFERLGLSIPKTWDEFLEVCAKAQEAGYIPTTLRFDFRYHQWLQEILWDQYARPQFQIVHARPGDWCFNPEVDRDWEYDPSDPMNDAIATMNQMRFYKAIHEGTIRYDTPEVIRLLKNMKAIAQYGPSDFLVEQAGTAGDPYSLFLRQEAVMHLDGTWVLPQIEKDMSELGDPSANGAAGAGLEPFRWGVFDPPPQVNPLVMAPVRSIESSSGEYISVIDKNQPQTDMVLDFVMFWLSAPGYQAYVDGQVEANEFIPTGKIMVRDVRMPEKFERLFAGVNMVGNAEIVLNQFLAFAPAGSRLTQDGRQTLVDYIQGRIEVDEAVGRIQTMVVAAVEESMARNNLPMALLDHPEADPSQFR